MGAQEPPARRAARLVAVAAQRAGPSYALPGQAASSEHWDKCAGSGFNRRHAPNWVRIQPALTKKVRRHLAHARKRKGFGWERWSRPWLYDTLGLFNSYRVRHDGPKVAPV